jgi:DNA-binding GntR family transcriptional regulator
MGIHRTCMRDQIRSAIVSRILDGSAPPGTHLKEMALAREFNVSQAPVREALRELEGLGLLEVERYRGSRVRTIDMEELREAYELRAAIEESAARLAVPCAKADIEQLEGDLKLLGRADRKGDSDGVMDNAVNFHRHIVQMSGNKLYLRAWEHMAWDIRARIAVQRIGLVGLFTEERKAIVNALRAGDGEKAGRLLRQILGELLDRLAQIQQAAKAAAQAGAGKANA